MKKLLALLALCVATVAHAWEPTKPVSVVIAYGPGSGNEVLFRKLETIISKTEKVKFVIELLLLNSNPLPEKPELME